MKLSPTEHVELNILSTIDSLLKTHNMRDKISSIKCNHLIYNADVYEVNFEICNDNVGFSKLFEEYYNKMYNLNSLEIDEVTENKLLVVFEKIMDYFIEAVGYILKIDSLIDYKIKYHHSTAFGDFIYEKCFNLPF